MTPERLAADADAKMALLALLVAWSAGPVPVFSTFSAAPGGVAESVLVWSAVFDYLSGASEAALPHRGSFPQRPSGLPHTPHSVLTCTW